MPDAAPSFFCAENSHGVKTPLQEAQAAAEAAPFLFSETEIGFEKLEAVGEFTGERLLTRRPETYRAVVRMAAEGLSISATARALGVSRNTVTAVRERENFTIEQDKKELLRDVRKAARLSVERAIELIPTINNAKDAAIVAAVMVDKAQLLAGEATSRVERVDATEDKLRDMLAALPVLEAEVLIGPRSGAPGQKEPSVPGLPGGVGLPVDVESSVFPAFHEGGMALSATLSATSCQSAAAEPVETSARAEDLRGGEGVEILAAPPHHTTHQGSQKILSKGDPSAPPPAAP